MLNNCYLLEIRLQRCEFLMKYANIFLKIRLGVAQTPIMCAIIWAKMRGEQKKTPFFCGIFHYLLYLQMHLLRHELSPFLH